MSWMVDGKLLTTKEVKEKAACPMCGSKPTENCWSIKNKKRKSGGSMHSERKFDYLLALHKEGKRVRQISND